MMNGLRALALTVATGSLVLACKTTPEPEGGTEKQEAPVQGAATAQYPQCKSQSAQEPEQRAPAFFSEMAQCQADVSQRAGTLAQQVGTGTVNNGRDCVFENGISCHYHGGKEFLADPNSQQEQGVGELHCIVPGDEPTSPTVFGAQLRCREGSGQAADGSQQCRGDLLEVFSRCNAFRCCDDGSLTKEVSKMSPGEKALQPDFRICDNQVLEIDCSLLAPLTAYTLYVPALGGTVEPVFTPGAQ